MELLEYQRLAMRTRGNYMPHHCVMGLTFTLCGGRGQFGDYEFCSDCRQNEKLNQLNNAAMGLCGESGEFIDLVKKILWHEKKVDYETLDKLQKELGDVLWYVALASDALNFHLDEVARTNISKLKKRYPDGFNPDMAQKRLDET